MGRPAANQGAKITATDKHNVQAPNGAVSVMSDPFSGQLSTGLSNDVKIKGKPADFAKKAYQEFNEKAYHAPQDEVQPDWDYSGLVVLAGFALDVARGVADADRLPTWNPGDEFLPAREKSGVK